MSQCPHCGTPVRARDFLRQPWGRYSPFRCRTCRQMSTVPILDRLICSMVCIGGGFIAPMLLLEHELRKLGKVPVAIIWMVTGLLATAIMMKAVAAFARFVPKNRSATTSEG